MRGLITATLLDIHGARQLIYTSNHHFYRETDLYNIFGLAYRKVHNLFCFALCIHFSIEFSSIDYESVVGSFRYFVNAIIRNY